MQAFNNGQDTRRVYLYSVHDITIVNLLRTMGFRNEYFKPEYGATLIFEMHVASNFPEDVELKVLLSKQNRKKEIDRTSTWYLCLSLTVSLPEWHQNTTRSNYTVSYEYTKLWYALSTKEFTKIVGKRASR